MAKRSLVVLGSTAVASKLILAALKANLIGPEKNLGIYAVAQKLFKGGPALSRKIKVLKSIFPTIGTVVILTSFIQKNRPVGMPKK